jgi:hypothetical protein
LKKISPARETHAATANIHIVIKNAVFSAEKMYAQPRAIELIPIRMALRADILLFFGGNAGRNFSIAEASKKNAPTPHINSPNGTGIPRSYHPRTKKPLIGG